MTSTIRDVSRERRLTIEGNNDHLPGVVFVTGPSGLVIEFDRATFIAAVAREFGLVDPFEVMVGMPAAQPPPPANCACCGYPALAY